MTSLKQKSVNGMLWTVSERLSLQAVGLIISVVLARFLEPSEFGLIAMLAIFTAVGQSILDSGFGSALIQKKDADQTDASSIFFFNLIIGIILAAILSLGAPLIALFFDQPILVPITRVMSLSFVFNAFSLVQTSLLTKRLDFRTQMKVNLIATIGSGVIGITLAYIGSGVWALVVQIVTRSMFQAVLLWVFHKWRPLMVISFNSLKTMFAFGSRLLASGILSTFFNNFYRLFIGRYFSVTDLGFYQNADTLQGAIGKGLSSAIERVLFPAMSAIQEDDTTLKKAYSKTIRLSLFLHFPLMFGLWAIASPLLRLLLTDKWAPSIPFFQVMCLIGLFYPLHLLNLNLLNVKGRSDIYFRLGIIRKVFLVLNIVITYRWGIMGLLYGSLVKTIIVFFINSYYSGRLINYSPWNQIKDFTPTLFSALAMAVTMYFVGKISITSDLFMIILQTAVGIGLYYLFSLFTSASELKEVESITMGVLKQLFGKLKVVLCPSR